jgi:transcriptional regulator with XRE-family HTH domain
MRKKQADFAGWLGHQMRKHNITGRMLAAALGMTHPAINHWVTGEAVPSDRAIEKLAIYFKVDKLFFMRMLGRVEGLSETQLTDEELDVLRSYRALNFPNRARARAVIAVLRDEPEE